MPYRTRKPYKRLRKRWYAQASIPKSVPFVGGSSFKAGSGRLTKRSLTTMIRSGGVLSHRAIQPENFNLANSTHYTFNPLGNIPIGTGNTNRVGTDIFVKKIRGDFVIRRDQNASATATINDSDMYLRVMWLRSQNRYLDGSDDFGTGFGTGQIFLDGTSEPFTGTPDKDKVTVLADKKVLVPAANFASQSTNRAVEIDCPVTDFSFMYESTSSNFSIKNKNVYCVVIPFVQNAGTTTVVGALQSQFAVIFNESS